MTSTIRIGRIINPLDLKCVLVDCSSITLRILTSKAGVDAIRKLDGLIVTNTKSLIEYKNLFLGRTAPSYILRVDYDVLQTPNVKANIEEIVVKALQMDYSAIISTFIIGSEDERVDSDSMKLMTILSEACHDYNLPYIVEAVPFGGRISNENYGESVRLAARMAEEVGASLVAVPPLKNIGDLKRVRESVKIHMLLMDPLSKFIVERNPRSLLDILFDALHIGLNGIILGDSLSFGEPNKLLLDVLSTVHIGG